MIRRGIWITAPLLLAMIACEANASAENTEAPALEVQLKVIRVGADSIEAKSADGKRLILRRSAISRIAIGELKAYEISLEEWERARHP